MCMNESGKKETSCNCDRPAPRRIDHEGGCGYSLIFPVLVQAPDGRWFWDWPYDDIGKPGKAPIVEVKKWGSFSP